MTVIGTGATRIVFLVGGYAIKIPRFYRYSKFYGFVNSILSGWSANRIEYVWSKASIVDALCPVKYSFLFSFIIVMERLSPLTEEEFNSINVDELSFGGYEHKIDSFGKDKDGNIKIIDYG